MTTFFTRPDKPQTYWPVVSPEITRTMGWYQEIVAQIQKQQQQNQAVSALPLDPIKNVLAVGALCCEDGINQLDLNLIEHSLELCIKNGFSVEPEPDLTVLIPTNG